MDATWRRIMGQVKETPLMVEVAEFDGLLDDLIRCNQSLDVVEKGLNDFLDTKKMAFPRCGGNPECEGGLRCVCIEGEGKGVW
jgi:dynein heavy chain